MRLAKQISLLSVLFLFLLTSAGYAQKVLTIGDDAPVLKFSKWVKGTPIEKLEKGNIYVVEFWATWCGPCRQSIPHLTELAHKYKGKVTFIGADVWDNPTGGKDLFTHVSDFVHKEMGDKMDYNVAIDSDDKHMAENWMSAAAQNGIPAAFIVDKNTKIAWIGHPMEMDEALAKIVEGTYDGKEYAAKLLEEQKKTAESMALSKKFQEAGKPILDAFKAKDYKTVVAECEKLAAAEPSLKSMIDRYHIMGLVKVDPAKAIEKANTAANEMEILNYISTFAGKDNDKKLYDWAIEKGEKLAADGSKNLNVFYFLANIYETTGNNAKAITALEKFLESAREQKIDEKNLQQFVDKIKKLKEAK